MLLLQLVRRRSLLRSARPSLERHISFDSINLDRGVKPFISGFDTISFQVLMPTSVHKSLTCQGLISTSVKMAQTLSCQRFVSTSIQTLKRSHTRVLISLAQKSKTICKVDTSCPHGVYLPFSPIRWQLRKPSRKPAKKRLRKRPRKQPKKWLRNTWQRC